MKDLVRRLDPALDSYLRVSGAVMNGIAMAMFAVMLVANGYNIALRSLADRGIMWHQEVSLMAAFWIYFGAYSLLAKEDGYIRVEFVVDRLAPRLQAWILLSIHVLVVAFHVILLVLCIVTFRVVSGYETPILQWPEGIYYVPLAVGTADIVATEVILLARLIAFPDRPRPKGAPPLAG